MHERSILRLRFLHKRLEREIETEQSRRLPDRFRVLRLKKLKLAIKDHMARQSAPHLNPT